MKKPKVSAENELYPPELFGGFSARGRKGKSTSVLKSVHLQPGAEHPVCMARNHFQA